MVAEVADPETEISLPEARGFENTAMVGDEIRIGQQSQHAIEPGDMLHIERIHIDIYIRPSLLRNLYEEAKER